MSARETLNRWVEAMQILCGHDDNPGPERRAGYEETRRKMIDAAYAELLTEAAEAIDVKQDEYEAEERRRFGHLDHETVLQRDAVRESAALLRQMAAGEEATAAAATATPDFFQPGHTYAREHHASTIRFLVRYIDDSPEGIPYRVAFGWKTEDGDVCASPFDSDDMDGWVDVTGAGDGRG